MNLFEQLISFVPAMMILLFFYKLKNKYNSENSSSVTVREGTSIEKWHRLNKDGSTGWAKLCSILGLEDDTMSEEQYHTWVRQQISNNQEMISFEE